jgi:hypothetical protein
VALIRSAVPMPTYRHYTIAIDREIRMLRSFAATFTRLLFSDTLLVAPSRGDVKSAPTVRSRQMSAPTLESSKID